MADQAASMILRRIQNRGIVKMLEMGLQIPVS
jgi:hypothetical protein